MRTPRWAMRVKAEHQGGIAEIGRSKVHPHLITITAGTQQIGRTRVSVPDAKVLRRALSQAIREIETELAIKNGGKP